MVKNKVNSILESQALYLILEYSEFLSKALPITDWVPQFVYYFILFSWLLSIPSKACCLIFFCWVILELWKPLYRYIVDLYTFEKIIGPGLWDKAQIKESWLTWPKWKREFGVNQVDTLSFFSKFVSRKNNSNIYRPSEFSRRDKMWSASLPRIQITTLYSTNTTIFCPKIDRPGSQDFPHLDN